MKRRLAIWICFVRKLKSARNFEKINSSELKQALMILVKCVQKAFKVEIQVCKKKNVHLSKIKNLILFWMMLKFYVWVGGSETVISRII